MLAFSTVPSLSCLLSLLSLSSKSLVSFFGGIVVAAQVTIVVVSGLDFSVSSSIVKGGFQNATRTTAVILEPTRCPLSNSTASPGLLFFGYIIIMLVSLVCTLGVKGFFKSSSSPPAHSVPHAHHNNSFEIPVPNSPFATDHAPPPPPTDPDSETDPGLPRKRSFLWILLLLFSMAAAILAACLIKIASPGHSSSYFTPSYVAKVGAKFSQVKALAASWVPTIPRVQIGMMAVVACLSLCLSRLAIFTCRLLQSKVDYRMHTLYLDPFSMWLSFLVIHVSVWPPLFWLWLVFLDFYFDIDLWTRFWDGEILALLVEYIGPFASSFPGPFSPLETLVMFAPASVFTALPLMHVGLRILFCPFALVARRHYAQAIIVIVIVFTMGLHWIHFLADLAEVIIQAVVGRASPVWNSLHPGYKIVLVGPAMAHYLRYYVAPIAPELVRRIKAKARARWRLGS